MDFFKPKQSEPEAQPQSDGLLVWIDCEVSLGYDCPTTNVTFFSLFYFLSLVFV